MAFKKWNSRQDYSYLDASGRYEYALGAIPEGTTVKFSDGDMGSVVNGNNERSLVSYRPAPESGFSEARDWFNNRDLEVEIS